MQPKDIHVSLEMSLTEIDELLLALNNSKIDCEGNEKVKKASETLTKFFGMLSDVFENVQREKNE